MKKLLALLLVIAMTASFVACGKAEVTEDEKQPVENLGAQIPDEEEATEETKEDKKEDSEETPQKEESKKEDPKKEEPEKKPADKPTQTPENKPAEKPVEKPVEKPADKPTETSKTVAQQLVAEFNSKASSGSPLAIAESIANGGSLPFMAGAMEVEEGLLSGFDNYEVKGFKSGAVFMPMIGSIPFIGYVFELADGASASDFVSNLKANANKRWNICVTADEMATSVVGNKVFFVMCPEKFEE